MDDLEQAAFNSVKRQGKLTEWNWVDDSGNIKFDLPMQTLDLAMLADERATSKQYLIERIVPAAEVTLLNGGGATGKSLAAQQAATAAAAGLPFLGLRVEPGPAIYLTCEDDADQLHWRQQHICEAMSVPMASLADKLHLISLRGALNTHLCTFAADGTLERQPAYSRLRDMIEATGSKLVFLDNLAHLFTGNESDRGQVTRFINLLNKLAGETGAAIILLAHPNKAGDSYSGSTAWLNAVRSQVIISRITDAEGGEADPDARALIVGKANYVRNGEAVKFRWHNWAFIRDEDLPADTRAELDNVIKGNAENAAFMRCLEAATANKRAVSHNASPSFYANVFPKMREAKGMKRKSFEQAFERLLSTGKIELDARLWQRENRVWQCGIKAVEICTQYPAQHTAQNSPQVIDIACTEPHQTHTLLSKDNITGQALGQPAHDLDSDDWSKI